MANANITATKNKSIMTAKTIKETRRELDELVSALSLKSLLKLTGAAMLFLSEQPQQADAKVYKFERAGL